LAALGKAKPASPSANGGKSSSPELLQHLSAAGKFIRAEQFDQAAQELDSAIKSGDGPEAGFIMGELLRRQEQWSVAASVYEKILQENPDFPEAHTKLSYLMYRLGDPEQGLREAKTALARTLESFPH
jgi:TolA-binding protein